MISFPSGLSFDEMYGVFFYFENAIASVNDLNLKGTFGEMTITGNSNITNKTHDQKLTYIGFIFHESHFWDSLRQTYRSRCIYLL